MVADKGNKQGSKVVISGDRLVAMIEIVSPGNKSARYPLRAFVEKAAELLGRGIHLLVIDLLPPGKRDPEGLHNEIWQEIAGVEYTLPPGKPFTFAAYDSGDGVHPNDAGHLLIGQIIRTNLP